MLRFTLFGFPVTIHWGFWITALLLGMNDARGKDAPALYLLVWSAAVLVSILVHELGHAIFMKRFGTRRPQIYLYWLGGLASTQGRFTRRESIIVSLMGPVAGLVLGGAVWLTYRLTVESGRIPGPLLFYAFGALIGINLVWSLMNLLPILPLDGGHVVQAASGYHSQHRVYQVGFVVATAIAILAFFFLKLTIMGVLFGFLAYSNFQRMQGKQPHYF